MMQHLKFQPTSDAPDGEPSGYIFNSATGQVLAPDGTTLRELYWDYPNIPAPAYVQYALNAVMSALNNHTGDLKIYVRNTSEMVAIALVTKDSSPGDPSYRSVSIPAGAVLDILHNRGDLRTQLLSLLGWQA